MVPFPYKDENPSPSSHLQVLFIILLNLLAVPLWTPASYQALGFLPADPDFYRWFTSQFLHAGWLHFAGNMWFLWVFGDNVEWRFGGVFLPFYLASGLAAAALHLFFHPGGTIPAIGASGAISGVIGAYLVLFPAARLSCLLLIIIKPVVFSMRALWWGLLYVGMQFLMTAVSSNSAGVAYDAHLGGAVFGMVVACLARLREPELEVTLAGEPPAAPPAPRERVSAFIAAGDAEAAVQAYVEAVRKNPYFELSARSQLWVCDRLARLGRPHVALAGLDRFRARHGAGELAAHAALLAGWIEQAHFLDFPAAEKSYSAAARHPKAAPEIRADAERRLAAVRRVLEGTFTHQPRETDRYYVLLEGAPRLGPEAARIAARLSGRYEEDFLLDLREAPGVVAARMAHKEAGALAKALEAKGIAVLVLPEAAMQPLPAPEAMASLRVLDDGLEFADAEGKPARAAWKDLALLSAAGLRRSARVVPVLEAVTLSGRRFRWSVPPEGGARDAEKLFFDSVQEALLKAKGVPVDRGARGAFHREIPAEAVFDEWEQFDGYARWCLQLAHLRRAGPYRAWAEAAGGVAA